MARWIRDSDSAVPLNLVIANAGVALGAREVEALIEEARAMASEIAAHRPDVIAAAREAGMTWAGA